MKKKRVPTHFVARLSEASTVTVARCLRQFSLEELDRIGDHASARVHDVFAPGLL